MMFLALFWKLDSNLTVIAWKKNCLKIPTFFWTVLNCFFIKWIQFQNLFMTNTIIMYLYIKWYIYYKLYLPIIFYSNYLFYLKRKKVPLTLAFSILCLLYLLIFFLFIINNDPLTLAFANLFLYFWLVLFLLEKKTL